MNYERKDFTSYDDYKAWIDSLPEDTSFDENETNVQRGDFPYLMVTVPDMRYRVTTPHKVTDNHEYPLTLRHTEVQYRCPCGETDSISVYGNNNGTSGMNSYCGCCGITIKATVTVEEVK